MLSRPKTAILALIGVFTMGLAVAPVSAAGNRGQNTAYAKGDYKAKRAHKGGYKRGRKYRRSKAGKKHARAARANYRHRRPGPPRWAPAHGYRRKYQQRRRNQWYWHQHRYHRHKHWRSHHHGGGNELAAGLIGAAIGAVLASQASYGTDRPAPAPAPGGGATSAVIGTGAVIGGDIGRSMNGADQDRASNVLETSRTGHSVEWQNPETGNRYTMTPTRTYRNSRGQDCRAYTAWGWVGGYEEKLNGSACRSAAGGWQLAA